MNFTAQSSAAVTRRRSPCCTALLALTLLAASTVHAQSSQPFIIPGGGASTQTPLWIALTKIVCEQETDDGSDSDEVYVMVTTVALNRANMQASQVSVRFTSVYEDFDAGDVRVPNMEIWGSENSGKPIPDPRDVIIFVAGLERDGNGSREMTASMIKGLFQGKLGTLSGTLSHKQISDILYKIMWQTMESVLGAAVIKGYLSGGDDFLGMPAELPLSTSNLQLARQGTVVKLPMDVWLPSNIKGRYQLRFQLGRQGETSIHW
jgi:hypothetical protein